MDIAAWYCNSALNIESLISVTAFETVFDVADIVACCVAFLLVPLEECQSKISFF